MTVLQIIGCVLMLVVSIALVVIVLAQQGRSAYLGGAIAGGAAESFLGKKKARTIDSTLSRLTKILAIVFVALTIAVDVLAYMKK